MFICKTLVYFKIGWIKYELSKSKYQYKSRGEQALPTRPKTVQTDITIDKTGGPGRWSDWKNGKIDLTPIYMVGIGSVDYYPAVVITGRGIGRK
jgi:hypothetical protein